MLQVTDPILKFFIVFILYIGLVLISIIIPPRKDYKFKKKH